MKAASRNAQTTNGAGNAPGPGRLEASPGAEIAIDPSAGTLRVRDPRVFRAGQRAFCRRLAESAARHAGVRKLLIDLPSASCRIEFEPGAATSEDMARHFTAAVHDAAASSSGREREPFYLWPPRSGGSWSWSILAAYRFEGEASLWEALAIAPGRVRLDNRAIARNQTRLRRLAEALPGLAHVEACRVTPRVRGLTLELAPGAPAAERLVDEVENALRDLKAGERSQALARAAAAARRDGAGVGEVAHGLKRLQYLALAGGCLVLTLVGLVVPGIPTVPFLLATSYYLTRSSPWLDEKLRRMAILGPILAEWEQHGALSRRSKQKLIALTGLLLLITLVVTGVSLLTLLIVALIGGLSLYATARIPSLPEEQEERHGLAGLALG